MEAAIVKALFPHGTVFGLKEGNENVGPSLWGVCNEDQSGMRVQDFLELCR